MAQWIRIHLPKPGFDLWSGEIPHAAGNQKPVCLNYFSLCAATNWSLCAWALWRVLCTREATTMRRLSTAAKRSRCSPQLDRACVQQRTPSPAKIKKLIIFLKRPFNLLWEDTFQEARSEQYQDDHSTHPPLTMVVWAKGWQCLDGEEQADVEDILKAELLRRGDGLDTKHRKRKQWSLPGRWLW